jgi:shikimate dehydrogenase
MAQLPFRWIDLEEARDTGIVDRLPATHTMGRILSTHFGEGTLPAEVAALAARRTAAGTVRKIVLPANVGSLLHEILPLLSTDGGEAIVVTTTGPSGALLRAWSRRFHFPFVYASLPESAPAPGSLPVEPSQLPVDRMRLFFHGNADGPLFAVTGHPVAHSRSPYLHSRWMRLGRRRGLYVSIDIGSELEFAESIGPLAAGGFLGLNVTRPWKSIALEVATQVGPGATLCGVANCLTFRNNEVEAENTDLVAILRRLEELRRAGPWDGGELVVVGAGGAAIATLAAARELGVRAQVFARGPEVGSSVAERFGARRISRAEARPFPLVVHATDVGRSGAEPLDAPLAELIGPGTQVLDWVYSPEDRSVRTETERRGGQYEDGWRLLVYQAAASFGIWWGTEPDSEEIVATIAEGPCTA